MAHFWFLFSSLSIRRASSFSSGKRQLQVLPKSRVVMPWALRWKLIIKNHSNLWCPRTRRTHIWPQLSLESRYQRMFFLLFWSYKRGSNYSKMAGQPGQGQTLFYHDYSWGWNLFYHNSMGHPWRNHSAATTLRVQVGRTAGVHLIAAYVRKDTWYATFKPRLSRVFSRCHARRILQASIFQLAQLAFQGEHWSIS
jgi:hypothetical protein